MTFTASNYRLNPMKANALLKLVFDTKEKLAVLMRFCGRGWSLCYKWTEDGESGEPNPVQRTLDLIDMVYVFDPVGARQIAELPLQHFKSIQAVQIEAASPCDAFENAFKGLKEATEAGNALTNGTASLEEKERELLDVQKWVEENLHGVRTKMDEKRKTWAKRA